MARARRSVKRSLQAECTLESLASWDNLVLAAQKARKHKTRRPDVEAWWLERERRLEDLRIRLLEDSWRPAGYRLFWIHEPKRREIAAAPFEDRVVHHALCNVIQPLLERRFIARSFSCQIGKGTLAARNVCRELTNRHAYVLKCDVSKFFPNIDHGVLTNLLADIVRCPGVVALCRHILGSFQTGPEIPAPLFLGDDLAEAAERPRGLPIGNLTSQLWGNYYLDRMDHLITEQERHGAYLRYTDDFLLFGNAKTRLRDLREMIVRELARVRLKLAIPKSRMLATREGVPFCGMRFFPGVAPRILGATKRRFEKRRHRLLKEKRIGELTVSTFCWYQFSREANVEGLLRSYSHRRGG
jgi:RNA-directed DNA polymerase